MSLKMLKQAKCLHGTFVQGRMLVPSSCGVQNTIIRQVMSKKDRIRKRLPPKSKGNQAWELKIRDMQGITVAKPMSAKELKELEEFNKKVPVDDVWLQSDYPTRKYSFLDTITMHREFCSPEMFDSLDGFVQFKATLNFRTNKQTKFLKGFSNVITLPHRFDDGNEPRIVVICNTVEETSMAMEMGALYSGGADIIKMIERGELLEYEYDYLLCTTEMINDLTKVRKLIRDSFPTVKRGTTGKPLQEMLDLFVYGKRYDTDKIETAAVGNVTVTLGKLDMNETELKENLQCYIHHLNQHKKCKDEFITEGAITVLPDSGEAFHLEKSELIDGIGEALQAEYQAKKLQEQTEYQAKKLQEQTLKEQKTEDIIINKNQDNLAVDIL